MPFCFICTIDYYGNISQKKIHQDDIDAYIYRQLTLLKKINVSDCSITDEGANLIVKIFENSPYLQDLQICNATAKYHTITKVIYVLKCITTLRILNISCNNLNDKTAEEIASVIYNNPLLQILNISNNKISTKVVQIATALSKLNAIKLFDISKNLIMPRSIDDTASALARCLTLEELNLSHNLLTFTAVVKVAQAFSRHSNLQKLNMSGNLFSSLYLEGEFLVDAILSTNRSLVDLNVCNRNIRLRFSDDDLSPMKSDEGVSALVLQNLYLPQLFPMTTSTFKTIPAKVINVTENCPIKDQNVTSYHVDHDGGTFYNQDYDFAIVIPPAAVSLGDRVEIQATASHCGPYCLPHQYHPVSSIFWVSARYKFTIPVYLILSHYAVIKSVEDIDELCVLQACVHELTVTNNGELLMKEMSHGTYFDFDIRYCVLQIDHFCSFCMAKKTERIPEYFVAHCYTYDEDNAHIAEVCFCPNNNNCKNVRKYT